MKKLDAKHILIIIAFAICPIVYLLGLLIDFNYYLRLVTGILTIIEIVIVCVTVNIHNEYKDIDDKEEEKNDDE